MTMMIKDLSVSRELDGKDMSAVHGGASNSASVNAGQTISFGGNACYSPVTVVGPISTVSQNAMDSWTAPYCPPTAPKEPYCPPVSYDPCAPKSGPAYY